MELSGIRSVGDADIEGRTVFVRVDFNVPIVDGKVTDDARVRAAVPTIQALRGRGAKVVLGSHLGRPKGGAEPRYSLMPCGELLAGFLDADVTLTGDCVGDGVRRVVRDAADDAVVLLENLRFHAAEEKADPLFAQELASLAQVYVNDAFGTAHRAHASTYTMVQFFPERQRYAGLLIEQELRHLSPLLHGAAHPYVGVVGGAKVSDKLAILENLIGRMDVVLVGGAMAYTFLAAQGVAVGRSLVEADMFEQARTLLRSAEVRKTQLVLPIDHIVAGAIDATSGQITDDASIAADAAGFDIGPRTVELFQRHIRSAATVFWNGPLGVFERPAFSAGTFAIANALADAKATVVVGGGDSASALRESGRAHDVTHVSTGGGASLEFLEGRELPGIAALRAGHRFA